MAVGKEGGITSGRPLRASDLKDGDLDRFFACIEDLPNGCQNWTGTTISNRYGIIRVTGKNLLVHRVSWAIHNGPVPESAIVGRTCCNSLCVNPKHLELRTVSETHAFANRVCGLNVKKRNAAWDEVLTSDSPQMAADKLGISLDTLRNRIRDWVRKGHVQESDLELPLKLWHLYYLDARTGKPKLDTIREIRRLYATDKTVAEISRLVGLPQSTTHEIAHRVNYDYPEL